MAGIPLLFAGSQEQEREGGAGWPTDTFLKKLQKLSLTNQYRFYYFGIIKGIILQWNKKGLKWDLNGTSVTCQDVGAFANPSTDGNTIFFKLILAKSRFSDTVFLTLSEYWKSSKGPAERLNTCSCVQ